jgi:hypothetical protein
MGWPVGFVGGLGWSQLWKGRADDHVPRPHSQPRNPAKRQAQRRAANRRYLTRVRAEARAAGLCGTCAKNEPKPGCKTCVPCLYAKEG